jgi:hypothetical protein
VLIPFGHSPHYDLVADVDGRLLRIQIKTSTQEAVTPDGHRRSAVAVATRGGNQSWTGLVKRIDRSRFEFLFALTGDGRRWLIPSTVIEAGTQLSLGGPKYAEYEIEPCGPIRDIVYPAHPPLESGSRPGGVSKRTKDGGCKPSGSAFAGSNPASPIPSRTPVKPTNYERKLGQRGRAIINQKRRITIPQRAFFEAGFENGGEVHVRADGPGRIVIEQIGLPARNAAPA